MEHSTAVAAVGVQLTLLSVVVFQHASTADAGPLLSGLLAVAGTFLVGYAAARQR
ncbi:hypothetical protein [Halobaculum litoreum]|uniref:Uncharacterized protein n=1 Tax=Halobaculum litoreum TaxID=3031998 RepID=A0ABD5XQY9_9EURY|nr:hypothetical protein [Halobaculum sp. DT92]